MKFYNWLNEEQELDKLFEQGLEELKSQDVKYENIQLTESQQEQMNEAVLSVTFIISVLLAAPEALKIITKSLGWIYKKIKKLFGGKEQSAVEDKLLKMLDKWHHSYISVLRQILRAAGIFKAAKIVDKEKQEKATEVVFYTIVLGFAIYSGVATIKSMYNMIQQSSLAHAKITTLESVLTAIKSHEVKNFLAQVST